MIVAMATSSATVKLMMIPLEPPAPGTHEEYLEEGVTEIDLQGSKTITRDLAVKIRTKGKNLPSESSHTQDDTSNEGDELLIASVATSLTIWKLSLSSTQSDAPLHPQIQTSISAAVVSFQSSPRLDSLLLAEPSGLVRVFDLQESNEQPTSSGSTTAGSTSSQAHGRWVISYQTPFHAPENSNPALARRKKILSAAWVLGGRGILVLLEDGQWGIWDVSGSSQAAGKSIQDFTLHGYLNTSSTSEASSNPSQKRNQWLETGADDTQHPQSKSRESLRWLAEASHCSIVRWHLSQHHTNQNRTPRRECCAMVQQLHLLNHQHANILAAQPRQRRQEQLRRTLQSRPDTHH